MFVAVRQIESVLLHTVAVDMEAVGPASYYTRLFLQYQITVWIQTMTQKLHCKSYTHHFFSKLLTLNCANHSELVTEAPTFTATTALTDDLILAALSWTEQVNVFFSWMILYHG